MRQRPPAAGFVLGIPVRSCSSVLLILAALLMATAVWSLGPVVLPPRLPAPLARLADAMPISRDTTVVSATAITPALFAKGGLDWLRARLGDRMIIGYAAVAARYPMVNARYRYGNAVGPEFSVTAIDAGTGDAATALVGFLETLAQKQMPDVQVARVRITAHSNRDFVGVRWGEGGFVTYAVADQSSGLVVVASAPSAQMDALQSFLMNLGSGGGLKKARGVHRRMARRYKEDGGAAELPPSTVSQAFLAIVSNPAGANVKVDGQDLPASVTTPYFTGELPPGSHEVGVWTANRGGQKRVIDLKTGDMRVEFFELPATTLTVTVQPANMQDVKITVDGGPEGASFATAPGQRIELPPGKYEVSGTAKGSSLGDHQSIGLELGRNHEVVLACGHARWSQGEMYREDDQYRYYRKHCMVCGQEQEWKEAKRTKPSEPPGEPGHPGDGRCSHPNWVGVSQEMTDEGIVVCMKCTRCGALRTFVIPRGGGSTHDYPVH